MGRSFDARRSHRAVVNPPPQWRGRLAAGPWWLLSSGPLDPHDAHRHDAIEVVVHGGVPCVKVGDESQPGPIVVVRSREPHGIQDRRDHGLVVFISPDADVGPRLRQSDATPTGRTGRHHPVAQILGSLRSANWSQADEAVRRILDRLDAPSESGTVTWWRQPALDEALLRLPDGVDLHSVDLAQLAEQAGLPVERLTVAIEREIGQPIGSYVRWLRLVRAIELFMTGADLDEAARSARFTRRSEFTDGCTAMFGLNPRQLFRLGTWTGGA